MNAYVNSAQPQRPSAFGSFFKGAAAGLFSGALMALIVAAITPVLLPTAGVAYFAAAGAALAHTGLFMVVASTLFGGVMGAKRALFDGPGHSASPEIVPVPVAAMSGPAIAPAMTPVMTYADTAQQESPRKSWVDETRNSDARTTIEQILANGSMSDKDRASAILASREAADQQAGRA